MKKLFPRGLALLNADGAPQPMHADGTPADPKHFGTIVVDAAGAPNSQRHESGAQTDPHATGNGTMAHNTEHAAPLGGLAEGEGATAPSPGSSDEAKADEGTPGTPPSRGRIELVVPQFRSTPRTINRRNAESGSKPGTPGAPDGVGTSSAPSSACGAPSGEGPTAAEALRARAVDLGGDRLLPGDYLVHKRSGIELVYGDGEELQASRISLAIDNAKFALWCDGELTLFVGDTELTLKPHAGAAAAASVGGWGLSVTRPARSVTSTIPSCTGKFPFPTRELAEASAVRMRKRKSQHQAAQTYRCHHCGKWHIGGSRPAYVVHSTQNFKRRRREAAEVEGKD